MESKEGSEGLSNKPVKITITLPSDAYFLSGIRDFTLSLGKNLGGFDDQWAFRCQAVVDELCNNAIEYGSMPGQEIKITFITFKDNYLEFWVDDTGTGEHSLSASELTDLVRERAKPAFIQNLGVRGRGLPQIVMGWMDELEFLDLKPQGVRVRVRKYLRSQKKKDIVEKEGVVASNLALK